MKIHIASDHAGFKLKNILVGFLKERDFDVVDHGAHEYNEEDDFPDFINLVAQEISNNPEENKGIILGGSGQGEAITANRFSNVRAVVYYGGTHEIIKLTREHNNANVLSLGARFINDEEAKKAVTLWLDTPFDGDERHVRRIKKIDTQ